MNIQSSYASLLAPYKTLGLFADGPVSISHSPPFNMAVACDKSFKIYSQQLSIKVVSPNFPNVIRAIATYNQNTYIYAGDIIYKMQYSHLLSTWTIPQPLKNNKNKSTPNKATIILFDKIIMLAQNNILYIIDQQNQQIRQFESPFTINNMIHPTTYLNKLLLSNQNNLILINPITQKIIYQYTNIMNIIKNEKSADIKFIQVTPLVDIVLICLSNNQMLICNIKKDSIVFTMKQKHQITSVAFSMDDPYMATGDQQGTIILWDLQKKRIIYRLENSNNYNNNSIISHVSFVPGSPLLTAISCVSNSLKQYRINLQDNKTLSLYRERCGSTGPITNIDISNNKQICYTTEDCKITYSSLYTHSNNYVLPNLSQNNINNNNTNNNSNCKVIGNCLPYHIVAYNYNIQLYKQRTIYCQGSTISNTKVNTNVNRQYPQIGKMSVSGYLVVTMKNKVIKMRVIKPKQQQSSKNKKNKTNTRKNVGKLQILTQWQVSDITDIQLYNEHYLFVFSENAIYVYDFNTPTLISIINQNKSNVNSVLNHPKNLLAFQVRQNINNRKHLQQMSTVTTTKQLQIWDMKSLKSGRTFKYNNTTNCMTFTSDNRYILSAHINKIINVWSIIDNTKYQTIKIQCNIQTMGFTPDNNYLLTVYVANNSKNNNSKNNNGDNVGRQICIWNNYIGRTTTKFIKQNQQQQQYNNNQQQQYKQIQQQQGFILKFTPKIKTLPHDYRIKLAKHYQSTIKKQEEIIQNNLSLNQQFIEMINQMNNNDNNSQMQSSKQLQNIQYYNFKEVSKWLPLVYYDQIRQRNTIANDNQSANNKVSGIPFFMDFNNLTEQKQKLNLQLRKQLQDKKKETTQKRDLLLKDDEHSISFQEYDGEGAEGLHNQQYYKIYKMLTGLSIAEVDYQIRRYLLASNSANLSYTFLYIWENHIQKGIPRQNAMTFNILLMRYLDLLGTDILNEQLLPIHKQMLTIVSKQTDKTQDIVQRCVAILENRLD